VSSTRFDHRTTPLTVFLQESAQKKLPIMLVGNKCDLRSEHTACVKLEDGQRLARVSDMIYDFCSNDSSKNCICCWDNYCVKVSNHSYRLE